MDAQTIDKPETSALTRGAKVIVRARDAGVHFGTYERHSGREVTLSNTRRLWHWRTKEGISLSDVADKGLNTGLSKVSAVVASNTILDACEIIICTDDAAQSITETPVAQSR